jgi:hypothetical protein
VKHRTHQQTIDRSFVLPVFGESQALGFLKQELFVDELLKCGFRTEAFCRPAGFDLSSATLAPADARDDVRNGAWVSLLGRRLGRLALASGERRCSDNHDGDDDSQHGSTAAASS